MTPAPRRAPAPFWTRVRSSRRPVLMLDYDGTLAPFRVDRRLAHPYPGVGPRLARLLSGPTRLVIVSGRPAADLPALLGLAPHPEIWGCHGWERLLPDGRLARDPLPEAARATLVRARAWIAERGLAEHSEAKPVSVTLHWRGLPPARAADLEAAARTAWEPLAAGAGLELHPFDGGLELRHPGRDKGSAVNRVLGETAAGEAIAYLGDDLTDEDAFAALGGRGLPVLVRGDWRPSAAQLWLRPPAELYAFFDTWLDQVKESSA